jgi:hypothetical protein
LEFVVRHPRKTPAAASTLIVIAILSCLQAPTATARTDRESGSDEVARLFLVGPRRPWDVYDRTSTYKWFSVGRVYAVRDSSLNRQLIVGALGDGTPPVNLTGPENRKATADFLSRQFSGRFPGRGKVDGVAQLLKDVTLGPRGVIADRHFLQSQKWGTGSVREWLKGREKEPKVFEGICTGVETREDENEWQLRFNVFNTEGGVDRLTAVGTRAPLTIQRVSVEELKRAGEFFFPLEGSR